MERKSNARGGEMNQEKIAILVDSGVDVPKDVIEKYGMYMLPLKVIFKDAEYLDRITITPQEVYERLNEEIPKTSLPSGADILDMFERIQADGYAHVLVVTISSGLSGTYNAIRVVAEEFEGLDIFILDTKNIGIAAGVNAIQAAQYVEAGMKWERLKQRVSEEVSNSGIFFCVKTLEYLQKGGRIGLVASILGSALNLKPIISCNEDGIYYTVAKVRGRKQSLHKALELAVNFIGDAQKYRLCLVHGNAKEEADELILEFKKMLPNAIEFYEGQISPALGVHTGPGLIGLGVQILK